MTIEQAGALLKLLMASYPQAAISLETQTAYVKELTDLDFVTTLGAVRRLVRTLRFFPSIAEICQAQQAEAARVYMERQIEDRTQGTAMSNAERRTWARKLAEAAAERRETNGKDDFWSLYLEQTAELYAENANRVDRNERTLPIPRVSELVEALMGKQAKMPMRPVTDAVTPEDLRP